MWIVKKYCLDRHNLDQRPSLIIANLMSFDSDPSNSFSTDGTVMLRGPRIHSRTACSLVEELFPKVAHSDVQMAGFLKRQTCGSRAGQMGRHQFRRFARRRSESAKPAHRVCRPVANQCWGWNWGFDITGKLQANYWWGSFTSGIQEELIQMNVISFFECVWILLAWPRGAVTESQVIDICWVSLFFPTCQVRVVRFYVSCPAASFSSSASAGPQLQTLDRSVPRRTGTASPGSECSSPDLNCKL